MIQPEDRIRLYLRKVEAMIGGFEALGEEIPRALKHELFTLKWVLGEAPDPPDMDLVDGLEHCVAVMKGTK